MQYGIQFLAVGRNGALKYRRGFDFHGPVVGIQKCGFSCLLRASFRGKERPEQDVGCCFFQQWIHLQRTFPWTCCAHGEPSLKHPKHRTRPSTVVQVRHDPKSTAALPRIVFFPCPVENVLVHPTKTVSIFFPSLTATTVYMRTECKASVTGLPDSYSICVRSWMCGGYQSRSVGRVPVGHEEGLSFQDVWVGSGKDLRRRPIQLIDSRFLGWKPYK